MIALERSSVGDGGWPTGACARPDPQVQFDEVKIEVADVAGV